MSASHHDLFELYFNFREQTEPATIFHRWAFLSVLSAWLGRNTWLPFGSQRIFPNQYIQFVGHPGSRKTTAIKQATKLLKELNYQFFSADKTSLEKFILDLAGEDFDIEALNKKTKEDILDTIDVSNEIDRTPKEMYIVADEFNVFMQNNPGDFLATLGTLWDWDDESLGYRHRLKNSKSVQIWQPTINILSGNTPQGFTDVFPIATLGQGFMSRLILIHGENSGKKFHRPPPEDKNLKDRLLGRLLEIRHKVRGPMTMHADADTALELIYKSWPDLDDQRFKHYSTRRYTHLLKLALLFTAARASTHIERLDVVRANTVLAFAETTMPKAMGELGQSRQSVAANKLMNALYDAKQPMTVQELYKVVRSDMERVTDLGPLLQSLQTADKIHQVSTLDGVRGYLPKRQGLNRRLLYVDFDYLKGKELP